MAPAILVILSTGNGFLSAFFKTLFMTAAATSVDFSFNIHVIRFSSFVLRDYEFPLKIILALH